MGTFYPLEKNEFVCQNRVKMMGKLLKVIKNLFASDSGHPVIEFHAFLCGASYHTLESKMAAAYGNLQWGLKFST